VAASAIAERFGLPRRVVMILEGESLVNDATGLVIYKFAIAAVLAGAFSLAQACVQFVFATVGGVAIGLIVGYICRQAFRRLRDHAVLITLSLLAPYVAYLFG
jgi:CPA1 family monovalent cation:H+ antiporter